MENIIIVLSTTLIPAVASLVTVVFTQLSKYRKDIISSKNEVENLKKELMEVHSTVKTLKEERDQLLEENILLKNRIAVLEEKIK